MATVLNAITELHQRLAGFFQTEAFHLTPVEGGASSRSYYRIDFLEKIYFPEKTIIVMVVPREDIRMLLDYTHIDYYLKRMGVKTPRLYEINRPQGWVFLQYETAPTLEMHLKRQPEDIPYLMPKLAAFLSDLQRKCLSETQCPAFQRRFDFEKYMFEFDFHVKEQLLNFYFKEDYDPKVLADFSREISTFLDIDLPVFTHRDFQSSNMFVSLNEGKAAFSLIDFQDARHGTPVYDLVSCLWDSYITVPDDLRKEIVKNFYKSLKAQGIHWDADYYQKVVDYSVIQRKLHDVGAFAYNFRRFNDKKFVRYIPGTMQMVIRLLDKYPHFAAAKKMFENLTSGKI